MAKKSKDWDTNPRNPENDFGGNFKHYTVSVYGEFAGKMVIYENQNQQKKVAEFLNQKNQPPKTPKPIKRRKKVYRIFLLPVGGQDYDLHRDDEQIAQFFSLKEAEKYLTEIQQPNSNKTYKIVAGFVER